MSDYDNTEDSTFAGAQDYEPGDVASVDWSDVPLGLTSDQTLAHHLGMPIHFVTAARTQRRIRVFSRAPRAEMPTYADAFAKMVRMKIASGYVDGLVDMRDDHLHLHRSAMPYLARVSDPTVLRAAFDAGWKAARA